jgi:hypothetical protein
MLRTGSYILLVLWSVLGIYFGVCTMVNEKLISQLEERSALPKSVGDTVEITIPGAGTFESKKAYELYLITKESFGWKAKVGWTTKFPNMINLLIGSCAFCVIGVVISIFKMMLFDKLQVDDGYIVFAPFLGMLTGFVVIALSYLVPNILTQDVGKLRPLPLMMISLLVGIFIEEFYNKISKYFTTKVLNS